MSAVVTMGPPPEPKPALPPVEGAPPVARAGLARLLGRHQIASLLSTAVDFGVMTLTVELLHVDPAVSTLFGASCGAVANFQLGRHWIYEARHEHVGHQAARYAFVSACSAGLNAGSEYGLHDVLGVQYLLARAIVAVAVSLLWNFPMQRYFVFKHR